MHLSWREGTIGSIPFDSKQPGARAPGFFLGRFQFAIGVKVGSDKIRRWHGARNEPRLALKQLPTRHSLPARQSDLRLGRVPEARRTLSRSAASRAISQPVWIDVGDPAIGSVGTRFSGKFAEQIL